MTVIAVYKWQWGEEWLPDEDLITRKENKYTKKWFHLRTHLKITTNKIRYLITHQP
jgi:hypothetical protein